MDLKLAKQAFDEAKTRYTSKINAPGTWDMLLGLEAMADDLDRRLAKIERNQQTILQGLQQLLARR